MLGNTKSGGVLRGAVAAFPYPAVRWNHIPGGSEGSSVAAGSIGRMARRFTRHLALTYLEQRARDEGALTDDEIAAQRAQAAVAQLLKEACDAAELYHNEPMLGCGDLLAALDRFLRAVPVKFHEDADPRVVTTALMSAIRDIAVGTDPELFRKFREKTATGPG